LLKKVVIMLYIGDIDR